MPKVQATAGECWGERAGGRETLLQATVNDTWEALNYKNMLQPLGPLTSNKAEFLPNG